MMTQRTFNERERKRLEKRSKKIEFFSSSSKNFLSFFFKNNNKTVIKKKTHNFKNFLYSLSNLNSK